MVELTTLLRRVFALIMLNKIAALVAVVWVIAALRVGVAMEPSTQEPAWLTHTDSQAGLEISYPADWEVIVAEERLGPGTKWTPLILGEGELFKVAFRESGDVPWPGWYEVRVLANNDSLTLDAYWAGFDLSDLWDRSDSDSTLAGRSSKTWVRWRHDSLVREHLLVTSNRAIHILYDEHNSNDPAFENHKEVYEHMTSTFRVLLVSEPKSAR